MTAGAPDVIAALTALVAEQGRAIAAQRAALDALTARVAHLERRARVEVDGADHALLARLSAVVGGEEFTSARLVEQFGRELADALSGACVDPRSPAEVGIALRRLKDVEIDGLRVEKVGRRSRDGERWRVQRAGHLHPSTACEDSKS